MGLYALRDAHQAWVLLLNSELKGRFLPSVFSASFRQVGLVREPLGLLGISIHVGTWELRPRVLRLG